MRGRRQPQSGERMTVEECEARVAAARAEVVLQLDHIAKLAHAAHTEMVAGRPCDEHIETSLRVAAGFVARLETAEQVLEAARE